MSKNNTFEKSKTERDWSARGLPITDLNATDGAFLCEMCCRLGSGLGLQLGIGSAAVQELELDWIVQLYLNSSKLRSKVAYH